MKKERFITTAIIAVMGFAMATGCSKKDADATATTAEPISTSSMLETQVIQSTMALLSDAPASDFQYEEVEGKITIKHYTGQSMEIAIPSQIDGKTVAVIGDYCFANSEITKVVCPNTIETIEEFAFANCYDLVEIGLNEGLQNIGKDAFLYCKSLEYIDMPSTLIFVDKIAFSGSGIKHINFLCGSVEWVNGAFFNTNIAELTIPSNLKTIGYAMFAGCGSLETVVIEEGIERIGERAFSSCKELKEVSIPASVTEIGEKVFDKTSDALVLTVQPGSYAETYAKENNIAYVNP